MLHVLHETSLRFNTEIFLAFDRTEINENLNNNKH